jgi:tetratricopeptide (TPR) repeat protein
MSHDFDNSIKSVASMPDEATIYDLIGALSVSERWKDRFYRIHTSYSKNYARQKPLSTHLWRYSSAVAGLPFKQRFNFCAYLNVWAFIFGPFYYFAKRMYKKAVILSIFCAILATYSQLTPFYIPFIFIYCGIFANRDYFVKMVLNSPIVKNRPEMRNSEVNEVHIQTVASRKNHVGLAIALMIAVILPIGVYYYNIYTLMHDAYAAVSEIPKVCTDEEDCNSFISENLERIKSSPEPEAEYRRNYKIACAYVTLGNRVNAIKFLDKATEQNPKFLPAWLTRAAYEYQNQNYTQAIYNYSEALEIAPMAKFLNFYIGESYYKMKNYRSALEYLELAVRADKMNPLYVETLAYAKIHTADIEGGIKDLEKAAKLYARGDKERNTMKIRAIERHIRTLKASLGLD